MSELERGSDPHWYVPTETKILTSLLKKNSRAFYKIIDMCNDTIVVVIARVLFGRHLHGGGVVASVNFVVAHRAAE